MEDQNLIQSVERTFEVIRVLSSCNEGISLTLLSNTVKLHKATVGRILKTLKSLNIVSQNSDSLKYSLGNGFLELSLNFLENLDLRKIALPDMHYLQEKTGETINLAILDGLDVIYIERVDSRQDLRHSISVGKRAPAYCTSLGRAILAFSDPNDVREKLTQVASSEGDALNKVYVEEILNILKKVRKDGYAIDDREHQQHIRCAGSPIFKADGKVIGAISISGPALRISDQKLKEHAILAKETALLISRKFGWKESNQS